MSAILHYQYSIAHFAAKAKHFCGKSVGKGLLPRQLLQTAGTGPAGSPPCGRAQRPAAAARCQGAAARRARLAPCWAPEKQNRRPESRSGSRLFFLLAGGVLGALFAHRIAKGANLFAHGKVFSMRIGHQPRLFQVQLSGLVQQSFLHIHRHDLR